MRVKKKKLLKIFSRPLVYTIAVLLPASYLIGLIFTLKTHSHIYDIHISDGQGASAHGQFAQESTSTYNRTGEVTTGHLLPSNVCINASIIAPNSVTTGVCGGVIGGEEHVHVANVDVSPAVG